MFGRVRSVGGPREKDFLCRDVVRLLFDHRAGSPSWLLPSVLSAGNSSNSWTQMWKFRPNLRRRCWIRPPASLWQALWGRDVHVLSGDCGFPSGERYVTSNQKCH